MKFQFVVSQLFKVIKYCSGLDNLTMQRVEGEGLLGKLSASVSSLMLFFFAFEFGISFKRIVSNAPMSFQICFLKQAAGAVTKNFSSCKMVIKFREGKLSKDPWQLTPIVRKVTPLKTLISSSYHQSNNTNKPTFMKSLFFVQNTICNGHENPHSNLQTAPILLLD